MLCHSDVCYHLAAYYKRLADQYLEKFESDEIREGTIVTQMCFRHMYEARLDTVESLAGVLLSPEQLTVFLGLVHNYTAAVNLAERNHDREIELALKDHNS